MHDHLNVKFAYCPSNTGIVRSKPHSGRHRTLCLRFDNTRLSQETNIHASGEMRTRNPSKRAAAGLRLRPRGH